MSERIGSQGVVGGLDCSSDRVVAQVGFGMSDPQRRELGPSPTKPLNDRAAFVAQDHFHEPCVDILGNEPQTLNEVASPQILRDDHVVPATEMITSQRDREIPSNLPGRFVRLPLAKMSSQVIDVDHKCVRVLIAVTIGERRLPDTGRTV